MMIALILISFLLVGVDAGMNYQDRVLLESIKVLNFRKHQYTTGRRSSPMPQISCVGGDACRDFQPEVIHCENVGFDGNDVSWKCSSELPNHVRFGATDVTCEGYDSPNDPYILKGSCAVEYTLHRTAAGDTSSYYSSPPRYYSSSRSSSLWQWFGIAFFLYFLIRWLRRNVAFNNDYTGSGGNGGGGGGGGYGGYFSGGGGGGYGYGGGYQPPGCGPAVPPPAQPGFWSGLTMGALGGWLMSGNNNRQGYYYRPTPTFGGGGGGRSSGSSTSTGYGSTRRR